MQWYLYSYPVFIGLFSQTAKDNQRSAWVQRIACVFSWIARIPTPNLDETVLETLTKIANTYQKEKLWQIGTESFLGGQGNQDRLRHHGERMFGADIAKTPAVLRDYLEPANKLLNNSDHWEKNLPTTTKLLHFMCPYLFPILDNRITKVLSIGKIPSYVNYHAYTFALQGFLVESKTMIAELEASGVNPLRLIDVILLNADKNE